MSHLGHPANKGLPTTTTAPTMETEGGAAVAKSDAADIISVCRSATLPRAAYQFYRALLLTFPATGSAPTRATLRALAKRYAVPLEATLADMARQDLVQRDPTTGAIRAAYPFSGVPTSHRVTPVADPAPLDAAADATHATHATTPAEGAPVQVYAMCALDALGIPLMLRREAQILSVDALTGQEVRVMVRQVRHTTGGAAVDATRLEDWTADWDPATAVVYARSEEHEAEHDAGACVAAGTCCPITNFFVTHQQAEQWAAGHEAGEAGEAGEAHGPQAAEGAEGQQRPGISDAHVLTQEEALRRAYRLFAGVLDRLETSA